MLSINEILAHTKGDLFQGSEDIVIEMVHFDSRLLQRNKKSLFVALTTGSTDGHQFIQAAQQQGAVAALVSRDDFSRDGLEGMCLIRVEDTLQAFGQLAAGYRNKLNIPVIAITGSNGKTTTKDMLAHILSQKFKVFKTAENYNNHLGVPLSLLSITESDQMAVLEMGMNHFGEIDLLARLAQPTIGVITNIGEAHIEFFKTRENIAKAKGELLPHVDSEGFVLLNKDDGYSETQAHRFKGQILFFSIKEKTAISASEIISNENGTSFKLELAMNGVEKDFPENKSTPFFVSLFGAYNIANLLPCIYIAYRLGVSEEGIRAALLTLKSSKMRFEINTSEHGAILINDAYNASPTSVKASVHTFLSLYPNRKKMVVLGDIFELGEQSEAFHREVGLFLADKEVDVITIGKAAAWISQMAKGTHYADKHEAAEALKAYLTNEYALLFKASRGMRLEELIERLAQGPNKPA